jgi:hypothetical protein
MNVEIGTESPIFLFWEDLFQNIGILSLQCVWEQIARDDFAFYVHQAKLLTCSPPALAAALTY